MRTAFDGPILLALTLVSSAGGHFELENAIQAGGSAARDRCAAGRLLGNRPDHVWAFGSGVLYRWAGHRWTATAQIGTAPIIAMWGG